NVKFLYFPRKVRGQKRGSQSDCGKLLILMANSADEKANPEIPDSDYGELQFHQGGGRKERRESAHNI
ncbi:MAG: hypothetical protein WAN11_28165, partial [Syntrophobacteraceae bacterium]